MFQLNPMSGKRKDIAQTEPDPLSCTRTTPSILAASVGIELLLVVWLGRYFRALRGAFLVSPRESQLLRECHSLKRTERTAN